MGISLHIRETLRQVGFNEVPVASVDDTHAQRQHLFLPRVAEDRFIDQEYAASREALLRKVCAVERIRASD